MEPAPCLPGGQPGRQPLRRHRTGEQVALRPDAAAAAQLARAARWSRRLRRVGVRPRFSPAQPSRAPLPDRARRAPEHRRTSRSIFTTSIGSARSRPSEECPVPKSSSARPDAEPAERVDAALGTLEVDRTSSSVTSRTRRLGATPDAASSRATISIRAFQAQAARREVDPDRPVAETIVAPAPLLAQRAAEHEPGERYDRGRALGGCDEAARRQAALPGMVPAQQGLEADHLERSDGDDRLVVEVELAALQGIAEIVRRAAGCPP